MDFKRTEVHGPSQRTPDFYAGGGGLTDELPLHVPGYEALIRDIANGLVIPNERLSPMERAKDKLDTIKSFRHEFSGEGLDEVFAIHREIRAGRPPPRAPIPTERERLNAAKAALGGK